MFVCSSCVLCVFLPASNASVVMRSVTCVCLSVPVCVLTFESLNLKLIFDMQVGTYSEYLGQAMVTLEFQTIYGGNVENTR